MQAIDRVVFGDNQFFGINHMSQEKAQQLAERFHNLKEILTVYDYAYEAGIRGFMLNSNDGAKSICEHFIKNSDSYPGMHWYPSIPYPHKYASLVGEKGLMATLTEVVFRDRSAFDAVSMVAKGGVAVFSKDVIKLMQMLVDIEMRMFAGLEVRVIFLQNVITDLLLGYGAKKIFEEYCRYITMRYRATPGLITQNMPLLRSRLAEWNIRNVTICTSFNRIGYLMSPSVDSYVQSADANDPREYQIMAMSSLASGAISARSAYEFINRQRIQSVVFGASSRKNIQETMGLISLRDD